VAKFNNILESIGDTPHLRINKLFDPRVEVWVKLERQNPGGSIKDRIALEMIEDAERRGVLKPGATIVEPTSGNTGVGLALVAAVKGYKLILTMPESMSVERRKLMSAFGATFELTPRELGMRGAVEKAEQLLKQIPGSWRPGQFDNPANIAVHKRTTVEEIARDFPGRPRLHLRRRRNRRPRDGRRRGSSRALAGAPGLRRRTGSLAHPQRRTALGPSDPGHRRQLRSGQLPPLRGERRHRRRGAGCVQDDTPGGPRRRAAGRRLVGAVLAAVAKKLPDIADGARILAFTYDTGERYLSPRVCSTSSPKRWPWPEPARESAKKRPSGPDGRFRIRPACRSTMSGSLERPSTLVKATGST